MSTPEQSNFFRAVLNRLALALLRSVHRLMRAVRPAVTNAGVAVGRVLVRMLVLPVYRLAMYVKLRSRRLIMPTRGVILLLFTNRYLLHVMVVSVAVATIAANLSVRQVNAQDTGRGSLLYAMVTGEDARLTEQAVRPDLLVRDSRYTGPSSLLAVPDIDFDYDEESEPTLTAIAVPGTIVAQPSYEVPTASNGSVATRTKTEEYVVKTGDTLSEIAQGFGVTVGTVLWANSRTEFQYLRPGDKLRIPPASGVLVTVKKGDTLLALANKYDASVDEIVRANRLSPDETLPVGVELILPGGEPPSVASPIAYAPSRTTPSAQTAPLNVTKPPDANSVPAAGKLLWPTSGHVITQYYGWRHTGVDIDGDYSSPIYAAHDGVVTTAGWNSGGYGLQIVVTGNGVMSRSAHASKLFVKSGDSVKRGQVIAMVGTTGRSTGTHLHFEVYISGRRANPLTYTR